MQSFDTSISHRLGVDNDLCHPRKSVSFWAVTFITLVVPLNQIKHYGTIFGFALPVSTAVAAWAVLFLGRRKIAALAAQLPDEASGKLLKAISTYLVRLAAAVAMVSFLGRF
jgi:hypothetical protein